MLSRFADVINEIFIGLENLFYNISGLYVNGTNISRFTQIIIICMSATVVIILCCKFLQIITGRK